jgi:hypothetical protein
MGIGDTSAAIAATADHIQGDPRLAPVRIDPDAYYGEAATAALLDKSTDTLRRMRWKGNGPPFCKYGRSIFYRGRDLIAAIEGSLRRSTSDSSGRALGA